MLLVRDWLPNSAIVGNEVRSVLEAIIEGWSQYWFGLRTLSVKTISSNSSKPVSRNPTAEWKRFGDGVYIDWSEHTQMGLVRCALDAHSDMSASSEEDKKLLRSFAFKVAKDLIQRLDQKLKFGSVVDNIENLQSNDSPSYLEEGVNFLIEGDTLSTRFAVTLETSSLARVRKQACAPFKPKPLQSFNLLEALKPSSVDFILPIGAAHMSAREFQGLSLGDVVILDHPVSSPLSLVSHLTERSLLSAQMSSNGENLVLTAI
jgi:hypothetical protein